MNVYLNGNLRNDILIQTGGSLEQNEAHVTSSNLTVSIPTNADDISAGDYISLQENNRIVFAGTIIEAAQQVLENINLSYKIYNLTLTNNSDYIANIFVDMTFPSGASVTQILLGNQPTDEWYNPDLGTFQGIIPVRVEQEDITVGEIDDFTTVTLESPAYLWGQTVSSVIDQLADVSDAWWEITNNKVFNMRYSTARENAPININNAADVYNVQVTRDAYTMYSAVRVVGGEGKSQYQSFNITRDGPTGLRFERTSPTIITSKYPLYSINTIVQQADGGQPTTLKAGVKGLNDDDPEYAVLYTYGGYEIECKDGYSYLDLMSQGGYIQVNGYLQIQIYARMVDSDLTEQIKQQRGGSGIIEYLLEDDTITDFADATTAAESFLRTSAQPAFTISFTTKIPGWSVGQLLAVELPYFNISGIFQVSSVSASSLTSSNGTTIWEYSVEASTIPYRDPTKALFYQRKTITFELDGSLPAADGQYLNNNVQIQTSINAYIINPATWQTVETTCSSWQVFQTKYPTWLALEGAERSWSYLGNYLTDYAKSKLLKILQGEGEAGDLSNLNLTANLYFTTQESNTFNVETSGITTPTNNAITASYYLLPDQLQELITGLDIYYANNIANPKILTAPVSIDRSPTNPEGQYSLTISVKHSII